MDIHLHSSCKFQQSRFDGENPQCVVDALLLQQQRLRDENNGKDVLTDLDILNDSKNIIGAGKWYFIHTTSTMEALYIKCIVDSIHCLQ